MRDFWNYRTRDAARLALQAAVAAATSFSILEAAGLPEKFVGILAATLVVKPSIGSTLHEGGQRFVATLVGCALGLASLLLLPSGYGTAAALGGSVLIIQLAAGFKDEWRYGVVAAVALALGSENDALQTALDRSIAIGIGVVVGAVVTLVVWPDRASTRAERWLREALEAAGRRLDLAVKATRGQRVGDAHEERVDFHRNLDRARAAANAVHWPSNDTLHGKLDAVEHFYNSVLFVNRVAEEGEEPMPESSGVSESLDSIRTHGCRIVLELAKGGEARRDRLEEVRSALRAIRKECEGHSADPTSHHLLHALLFSLDEVEDSLAQLVELYGNA